MLACGGRCAALAARSGGRGLRRPAAAAVGASPRLAAGAALLAGGRLLHSRAGAVAAAAAAEPQQQQQQQPQAPPQSGGTRGRLYLLDAKAQVYRLSHGYGDAASPAAAASHAAAAAAAAASPAPPPGAPPPPPGAPPPEESSLVAHGFLQILLSLFGHKPPPTHMAVVVDAPGATFRWGGVGVPTYPPSNLLYPDYKAHRTEAPAGLKQDLGRILDIVDALGVRILAVPGVEADDVIGALAAKGVEGGLDVTIVSPDKDFFQLLGPHVRLMRMIKAPKKVSLRPGSRFYTLEDFEAEHQLGSPALWADVMALQGDESDNIPGVRGIGAKSALRLVQACGGLEGVLRAEDWPGVKLNKKQRAVLCSEEGRAAARLARELVTIRTDLRAPAVGAPLESYRLRVPPDGGAELAARMAHYGLQWSRGRVAEVLARWAAAGGSPPVEAPEA
ncbi:DNA polymerase I [Raphidocelis subcapitata]|uniref:DNA polymerase I n=1 Tax=Raphidocelis subcapitata TaxID=307507 RepID=A0A2V0P8W9_9CHLO|nr:DNA polymerase I [Raphidocelis subcapitata]|eukprot:GBF96296.1 DNA polymerase I [Raphidocelis subcapitata]